MHEADLAVDQVEVQVQALALLATTSRRWVWRLPRTPKDVQRSKVEKTAIRPSAIPSRAASARAKSSLDSPLRWV